MHTHPPSTTLDPVATTTHGDLHLALYTGPDQPTGNAGDWWLPHYPDCANPMTHDGVDWELAALHASHIAMHRRTDLIELVFTAITQTDALHPVTA